MKNYQGFFLHVIYPSFIEFIMDGIGIQKFNKIVGSGYLFDNKRGINPKISKLFTKFLEANPTFLSVVAENNYKVFTPKNICGGILRSPIICDDDVMMVTEDLRPPSLEIDRLIFQKTMEEKEKVNRYKRVQALFSDRSSFRDIHRKPNGRLIIHLKNEDKLKNFKTTYNYICKEHEIKTVLETLHDGDIITSIKFNGKEI